MQKMLKMQTDILLPRKHRSHTMFAFVFSLWMCVCVSFLCGIPYAYFDWRCRQSNLCCCSAVAVISLYLKFHNNRYRTKIMMNRNIYVGVFFCYSCYWFLCLFGFFLETKIWEIAYVCVCIDKNNIISNDIVICDCIFASFIARHECQSVCMRWTMCAWRRRRHCQLSAWTHAAYVFMAATGICVIDKNHELLWLTIWPPIPFSRFLSVSSSLRVWRYHNFFKAFFSRSFSLFLPRHNGDLGTFRTVSKYLTSYHAVGMFAHLCWPVISSLLVWP